MASRPSHNSYLWTYSQQDSRKAIIIFIKITHAPIAFKEAAAMSMLMEVMEWLHHWTMCKAIHPAC